MADENRSEAWVTLRSPDECADKALYNFGFVPRMTRLIAAHPGIAPAFRALLGNVMFAPGALSRSERETVAAVAAAAQDCHY